jgi:7-cyano-7-deazaguanine reductase
MARKITGLRQLGAESPLPKSPAEAELERVPNPHPDTVYVARFTCPEFTCLCPVTGQPDFAHFVLDYCPRAWLVESKSLKLYLASFRNTGAFHEDATIAIGKRIVELVDPAWLRIGGYWYPRGGIPIDVFWQTARRRTACGFPTRAFSLIAAAGDLIPARSHYAMMANGSSASPDGRWRSAL